jgi:hypothetical protein
MWLPALNGGRNFFEAEDICLFLTDDFVGLFMFLFSC